MSSSAGTWGEAIASAKTGGDDSFLVRWRDNWFGGSFIIMTVVVGLLVLSIVFLSMWIWTKYKTGFRARRAPYMPDPGIEERRLLTEHQDRSFTLGDASNYVDQSDPDELLKRAISQ